MPLPVVALLIVGLMGAVPSSAGAKRGETILVSQTAGVGGHPDSTQPSISADGRLIAFSSDANNLSTIDNDGVTNVYVRDVEGATTTLVSQSSGGAAANGLSAGAAISANGRYVAFCSNATNLTAIEDYSITNLFLRDLVTGITTRVGLGNTGNGPTAGTCDAAISADGRYVAFGSKAPNLVANDDNGVNDVFVRDVVLGTTVLASVNSAGDQAMSPSSDPAISGDGRYVAFESDADNLSSTDDNAVTNVFVRDLTQNATEVVSRTSAGDAADSSSFGASLSTDGRFVAFSSSANNLSSADDNGVVNTFVRDRAGSTTVATSFSTSGAAADDSSYVTSISSDGSRVAFQSGADNLSTAHNTQVSNLFVRDLAASSTVLVSRAADGQGASAASTQAEISGDGRFVAFVSDADNLSDIDSDAFTNVYRQDLLGPAPQCAGVTRSVAAGGAVQIPLACSDADGDPLARSITSGPGNGVVGAIDEAAGTITYIPTPGFSGTDSFAFAASDASGPSAVATATITVVAPRASAPVIPIVGRPSFGVRTLVTLTAVSRQIPATGSLRVRVSNTNAFAVTGSIRVTAAGRKLVPKSFRATAHRAATVTLRLSKPLRLHLKKTRRLALTITARVQDPAGKSRSVSKRVTVRPKNKTS